ncbi:MAG TPA: tetratricopeptide repeat protein [Opitutaceae bacterium]|nr:tetratricopeptide repeat protein [Opitutaceae bacterium]
METLARFSFSKTTMKPKPRSLTPFGHLNIDDLIDLAVEGDIDGQFLLGEFYIKKYCGEDDDPGSGSQQDLEDAIKWFRLCAQQGDPRGQFHLADAITCASQLHRLSIEEQKERCAEAFNLVKLSAEQGYASAQMELATRYEVGDGVEKDLSIALKWMLIAYAQGTWVNDVFVKERIWAISIKISPQKRNEAVEFANQWFRVRINSLTADPWH